MRRVAPSFKTVSGFTLLELLVVISIITVLIAMLLPSLAKARETAKQLRCSAQLRGNVQSMLIYSVDYRGLLPDSGDGNADGTSTGGYDSLMDSLGGLSNGANWDKHARGLGLLFANGYAPNLKLFYCPMRDSGIDAFTNGNYSAPSRAQAYNIVTPEQFKARLASSGIRLICSYSYRGMRIKYAGTPAWGPSLAVGDRYIYSTSRLPKGAPERLALLSDKFSSLWEPVPVADYYHRTGYTVAYMDGSSRFVSDRAGRVAANALVYPVQFMGPRAEDIWDAFDGDLGTAGYNLVYQLE